MADTYIRRLRFPNKSVQAVTIPNDDGSFDVYINTLYPDHVQRAALRHELAHIRLGHFYSDQPIREKEDEADGIRPPAGDTVCLPLFPSPDAFVQWAAGWEG